MMLRALQPELPVAARSTLLSVALKGLQRPLSPQHPLWLGQQGKYAEGTVCG